MSTEEWNRYNNDALYKDDPLCNIIEYGQPWEKRILCVAWCKIKESDDINNMTYEMLIKWKKYTEEAILNLDNVSYAIDKLSNVSGGWILADNYTKKNRKY